MNPGLASLNKGPLSLRDFLCSSNFSGSRILTCVDTFTLQSSGLSGVQQSILLGAIQSARARSCRYLTSLYFPRPAHEVTTRDKTRILRNLSCNPLALGGERLFEFPGRSYVARRGEDAMYSYWVSNNEGDGHGGQQPLQSDSLSDYRLAQMPLLPRSTTPFDNLAQSTYTDPWGPSTGSLTARTFGAVVGNDAR